MADRASGCRNSIAGIRTVDQSGRLRRDEVGDVRPEQRRRPGQAPTSRRGRSPRRGPGCRGRWRKGAVAEEVGVGDARPDGEWRTGRRVIGQLAIPGEFDQGQRVPARLPVEAVGELGRTGAPSWRSQLGRPLRPSRGPASRSVGRSAPSSRDDSPSRTATITATGSATSRRNGKEQGVRAGSVEPVTHRRRAPLPELSPHRPPAG